MNKAAKRAAASPPAAPSPGSWLDRLRKLKGVIVAIAGVGAVLSGLLGYYTSYKTVAAVSSAGPASAALAQGPSIAVLPFVNMSSDKEQEYFSDGISEELLNLLNKVPQLRVIARTSSFAFKGEKVSIGEIAKKLNVATVLEGSVRKSGNQVRVSVQLVRAADSAQLWSQTYERTFDDIFKVQDDIAAAVVSQLAVKLLGAAPATTAIDPRAYSLILQAKFLASRRTDKDIIEANALYQQALAIAPSAVSAWTGLASGYNWLTNYGSDSIGTTTKLRNLQRDTVQKALQLDPKNGLAHALAARIATNFDGDLSAGARHFQLALDADPTNIDILNDVAVFLVQIGRLEQALQLHQYLMLHDPLNPTVHFTSGRTLYYSGKLDRALEAYQAVMAASPNFLSIHFRLGLVLLAKGDPQAALREMQAETHPIRRNVGLALAYHAAGRDAEAQATTRDLMNQSINSWYFNIACIFAERGEPDSAFDYLEKSAQNHDTGLPLVMIEPNLSKLHGDARWLPFLRKLGKAPEQLAAIPFNFSLPK